MAEGYYFPQAAEMVVSSLKPVDAAAQNKAILVRSLRNYIFLGSPRRRAEFLRSV